LHQKIKQDQLLDFGNIFVKAHQNLEQQAEELALKIASFAAHSLKNCAEHLEKLLAGRINAKVLSLHEVDDLLELSSLQK
jgi:hemoglobin-like flavoprotein